MNTPANPYASPTSPDPPVNAEPSIAMNSGSLPRVALGLRLVLFGLMATIVAEAILAAHEFWFLRKSAVDIYLRTRLLSILGEVIEAIGIVICLATPKEAKAKIPLRIAIVAALAGLAINLVPLAPGGIRVLKFIRLPFAIREFARFLLASTTTIALAIYLKRLAWFVRRRNLILFAQRQLGFFVALTALRFWQSGYISLIGNSFLKAAANRTTGHAVDIVWLVVLVVYALLIHGLRQAVLAKEARRERLEERG